MYKVLERSKSEISEGRVCSDENNHNRVKWEDSLALLRAGQNGPRIPVFGKSLFPGYFVS